MKVCQSIWRRDVDRWGNQGYGLCQEASADGSRKDFLYFGKYSLYQTSFVAHHLPQLVSHITYSKRWYMLAANSRSHYLVSSVHTFESWDEDMQRAPSPGVDPFGRALADLPGHVSDEPWSWLDLNYGITFASNIFLNSWNKNYKLEKDTVRYLLFHCFTFARVTPEDMKPQYIGAKWIEATLKAASIHFVDVWLHLWSRGDPGKRCGATILGIALGAPLLEMHHCHSNSLWIMLASWCVRTEKALEKRHEFWRRKSVTYTSIPPVVLLVNLQQNNYIFCWFIPIPEVLGEPFFQFLCAKLASIFWDCPGHFLFSIDVCPVPVFDASDSCLPLERGKPHLWRTVIRCETWHDVLPGGGLCRITSGEVVSFWAPAVFSCLFACTWDSSCAIFAAERST